MVLFFKIPLLLVSNYQLSSKSSIFKTMPVTTLVSIPNLYTNQIYLSTKVWVQCTIIEICGKCWMQVVSGAITSTTWSSTSILRCELLHLQRHGFVELVFSWY